MTWREAYIINVGDNHVFEAVVVVDYLLDVFTLLGGTNCAADVEAPFEKVFHDVYRDEAIGP